MPLVASAIPPALANEAIDELQIYNENIIAIAGALRTLKRRQIALDSNHMLRKYTELTKILKEKLLEIDSTSTITIRPPTLFLPSITTITDERPVIMPKAAKLIHAAEREFNHGFVSGVLALGKIDGGETEDLKKGDAFVWERGELPKEVGEVDGVYDWFRLDTGLDGEWRGTEYVVEGWKRPSWWTTAG